MSDHTAKLVPVLDGSNYNTWYKAMKVYLMAYSLWGYANGDITHPVLHTHLLPLKAQDNEELVHLQVDADTGNLHLLDMLLDLELFLCLAIDRWTACMTH